METPTDGRTDAQRRDQRLVRRCESHHFACDCREARFASLLEDTIRAHSTPDNGNYNECDKEPCDWCREARDLIGFGLPAKSGITPDPAYAPMRYTGHVPCPKCGTNHWMHGPCPPNDPAI